MSKKEKRVIRFSDLEPEPVEWLWPSFLAAGKLSLIDGDPSLGKSLITLDIAARLTTARPLPDGYTPPGPSSVLLVGAEDGLNDTVLPRLQAAGADLTRVHTFAGRSSDGAWNRPPTFPDDADLLREAIEETASRLVVIDPLTACLSTAAGPLNGQSARRALTPLAQIATATRAAVQMVRHLNKGCVAQHALYRGSGSIAIIGAARTAFLVGRSPDNDGLMVLACTKNNLAAPPRSLGFRITGDNSGPPIVSWASPVDLSADHLVLAPTRQRGEALHQAKVFLNEWLSRGPCQYEDLLRQAQESGFSERTLRRAKDLLHIESTRKHHDGHALWYWSLTNRVGDVPSEPWPERHQRALQEAQEQSTQFLIALCQKHASLS